MGDYKIMVEINSNLLLLSYIGAVLVGGYIGRRFFFEYGFQKGWKSCEDHCKEMFMVLDINVDPKTLFIDCPPASDSL